jgi:prophage regulatory protein
MKPTVTRAVHVNRGVAALYHRRMRATRLQPGDPVSQSTSRKLKVDTQPVIPAEGFVRVRQLIGDRRLGIVPILPISRSGMYAAIRDGRIPPPIKLGPKLLAWPANQIRAMLDGMKETQ